MHCKSLLNPYLVQLAAFEKSDEVPSEFQVQCALQFIKAKSNRANNFDKSVQHRSRATNQCLTLRTVKSPRKFIPIIAAPPPPNCDSVSTPTHPLPVVSVPDVT
jgi:hypothetical protein